MELLVPDLPDRAQGAAQGAPAHAVVRRGERRRPSLVPAERLPRRAGSTPGQHASIEGGLTDAELDHTLVVLLREGRYLQVYSTRRAASSRRFSLLPVTRAFAEVGPPWRSATRRRWCADGCPPAAPSAFTVPAGPPMFASHDAGPPSPAGA
jgi:hypothetical protein